MSIGPIDVAILDFPGSRFTGETAPVELHKQGVLTDEEFAAAKAPLLGV